MKQNMKNEVDLLSVINKIQEHLLLLDRKIDTLIQRSSTQAKIIPSKPPINNPPLAPKPIDHHQRREMYKAICADCQKECSIPFKPSGDRPVYCKDCFSRRKVISMSGIKLDDKPKEVAPVAIEVVKAGDVKKSPVKSKKKVIVAKKPVAKKKLVPKKK